MSKHKLIVHKRLHFSRLLLLVLMIAGIGVGLIALITSRDLRGRAGSLSASPSPLVQVEVKPTPLPPRSELESPYIRLATNKTSFGLDESVPVEIYIHSGEVEVMEVGVTFEYDPEVVELEPQSVELDDKFRAYQINEVEAGVVRLTLFVTPEVGHEPVIASGDTRVASLLFTTLTLEKANAVIELVTTGTNASQVVPFTTDRDEIENILNDSESLRFDVQAVSI